MSSKLILIIVPGKDDRAFYKIFLKKTFESQGLEIIDLDQTNYREEKNSVIARAFQIGDESPIKRSSVLKVIFNNEEKVVYLIIWPTERSVVDKTCEVLEYQSGLSSPSINYLVVAEDAEDRDFKERLDSLEDSLHSRRCMKIKKNERQGRHHRIYVLEKPENVRLILLVQGVEQGLDFITKHAIEDYVLYPYQEIIREIQTNCPKLFSKIIDSKYSHKKMALVAAAYLCYKNIEEFFYNALNEKELEALIESNDGLLALVETVIMARS